ncbi:type II toxin-antitoxin system RelE/ParE family toxin [Xenorhabdus santafensis]|uniref:type II toxin-antitoxin system RelE/ParE family toxin n=1 Tax=Xenorhabdus santafensis TaxID=2582833 RepID=UPI003F6A582D
MNQAPALEAQGNQLHYPHTDIIQDGLFELRAGKKDITRTFFAFAKGKKIYILRTFVKKTLRAPPAEIQLALKSIPGCFSAGDSMDDAVKKTKEAILSHRWFR